MIVTDPSYRNINTAILMTVENSTKAIEMTSQELKSLFPINIHHRSASPYHDMPLVQSTIPSVLDPPWTAADLQKCEKCFLGFLTTAACSLGAASFIVAAQSGTLAGRAALIGTGALFAIFGSCTLKLCVRRR